MKNTKEIIPLLTSVYLINSTNDNENKDITNLLKYLFIKCTNENVNMLTLISIGKTKSQIMPELKELLNKETNYKEYLEAHKKWLLMINHIPLKYIFKV